MTQIAYIHGISAGETSDRGKEINLTPQYIPYSSMTQGEMKLALLREQAMVYAKAYPEVPAFKKAVTMYDKALGNLADQGAFVGVIDDDLQAVARQIRQAKQFTAPAAGAFYGPRGINQFRIGADPIIPYSVQEDCKDFATRMTNRFYGISWSTGKYVMQAPGINPAGMKKRRWLDYLTKCETQKQIEEMYNSKLEQSSHHVMYLNISPAFKPLIGSRVDVKRLLHLAGSTALAAGGNMNPDLMKMWIETGILRTNATSAVGAVGSVQSSFFLDTDKGDALYQEYQNTILKKKKTSGIQIDPIVTAALITLITAALKGAIDIVTNSQRLKLAALNAAQGFGTTAYSAEKLDWSNITPPTFDTTTQPSNNLLPLALAAGGAYILLSK